jgi:hypothetical protein
MLLDEVSAFDFLCKIAQRTCNLKSERVLLPFPCNEVLSFALKIKNKKSERVQPWKWSSMPGKSDLLKSLH